MKYQIFLYDKNGFAMPNDVTSDNLEDAKKKVTTFYPERVSTIIQIDPSVGCRVVVHGSPIVHYIFS